MSGKADAAGLVRLRQALAAARGRDRVNLILDAPDPGALVRSLAADELYFTIQEAGLADAVPLVQLASPAQFRAFLDLDAWRKGQFDPGRAMPWVRAGRAGADRDDDLARGWRRKLVALDMELLDLLLVGALRIHDLEQDPDPEYESDRFYLSPDGKFAVEFLVEGTEYLAIRGLLDDLYAEDAFRAIRLLSSLRWELPSELEETALRWREGRLHDLGYPPLEEALSWFSRPARPASAAGPAPMPGAPARPPGFYLQVRPPGTLLGRASAGLPEGERDALELELVGAANATMVADGVDSSDLEAVRRAVESSRAMVELGLGALAGGDEVRAAEVLAATPVKALFQQGFGRVLQLKWRAEKVLRALRERGRDPGTPLAEALAALARRRPVYFPGIELPREEWGTPAAGAFQARPFLSEADLARTEAALVAAEELAKG
jgi:hypothetical protein